MKLHLPVSLFRLLLASLLSTFPATIAHAYVTHDTFTVDDPDPIVLSDYSTITISECKGYGIDNRGELNMKKNELIDIIDNEDSGISNEGTLEMRENGKITISDNVSDNINGSGISNSGTLEMSGNEDITISKNSNYFQAGGGIFNYSTLKIRENGKITISDNRAFNNSSSIYSMTLSGGGIFNLGTLEMSGNENISISDNLTFNNSVTSYGGGIHNLSTLEMRDNENIIISNNTASTNGERRSARGGGICSDSSAAPDTVIFMLSGNRNITISDNIASNNSTSIDGGLASGGGIYNYGRDNDVSVLMLCDNEDVTISNNTVSSTYHFAKGGGIYGSGGAINIINNQRVTFRGNLQVSSSNAILNAIYTEETSNGKAVTVTLAAPESGRMDFYDPILVKANAATSDTLLHLNGVKNEESGAYTATGGIIRFTGESAEADLLAAYQRAGLAKEVTQDELTASRTSSTNGHTALHGGQLHIVHQAIFETNGLTAESAGHATLRLENGTLRSTAAVTIERGATLAFTGENTLTASALDLQDGATLDITLGSGNTTDAVLTLDAALNTASLSLQLAGVDELSTGAYKLITLADAASYSADSWTESLVNVTGGSFDRLSWRDGTLYYRATSIVVEHGDSDTITDALLLEADYSPIVIREGVALFQQEHAAPLVVSYDSTTTEAGRLAQIDRSASFARLNVGAPEGSENVLQVEEEQTASTAALNGAGDLAKTGRGELAITGEGDHSGILTVRQGRVTLTGEGQLSSSALALGSEAVTYTLRRAAARNTDAPLIATESGITLTQRDSSRTGSLSGHQPLTAQGTAIEGRDGQQAVSDNLILSLDNAQATFTLGNLDLNSSEVNVAAAAGIILHDLRLDATSQVANRADVLAQMSGQNRLELCSMAEGGWVSVTTGGNLIQLSTEQLAGVQLTAGGSLTLGLGSDLLAEAGLGEGCEAELWLAGLTAAEGSALACEEVQGGTERLAVTIRSITREEGGTRLHLAVAAVPEPATGTLALLALAGVAARRRRK